MPNGKKRKTLQEILAELEGVIGERPPKPRGRDFLRDVTQKFAESDDRLASPEPEAPTTYPFLEQEGEGKWDWGEFLTRQALRLHPLTQPISMFPTKWWQGPSQKVSEFAWTPLRHYGAAQFTPRAVETARVTEKRPLGISPKAPKFLVSEEELREYERTVPIWLRMIVETAPLLLNVEVAFGRPLMGAIRAGQLKAAFKKTPIYKSIPTHWKHTRGRQMLEDELFRAYKLQQQGSPKVAQQILDHLGEATELRLPVTKGRELVPYKAPAKPPTKPPVVKPEVTRGEFIKTYPYRDTTLKGELDRIIEAGEFGIEKGVVTRKQLDTWVKEFNGVIDKTFEAVRAEAVPTAPKPPAVAKPLTQAHWDALTVPERVALTKVAGLEGKVGSKAWATLSDFEKNVLIYRRPPEATIKPTMPQGTLETPPPNQSRRTASEIINKEFYDAIPESELDKAVTAYLKEGDFERFIREMPEFRQLTAEEAMELGIALRATKGGKIVPAMRKSGFYVTDEFARYPEHRDVHPVSGLWQDPTRMMQNIDGGFFGGATQKYVLWPTQRTTLAKLRFSDEAKTYYRELLEKYDMVGKPATRKLAGDVIQHISRNEVNASVAELLKKPDIRKFIGRHSPAIQGRVIKFAQETRKVFDDLIDKQNLARLKRNQDPIAYRDNYRPWVIDTNLFSRLFGLRQTPKDFMARPQLADYIKPTQPFNPRAEAREGGLYGYLKEKDLQKLVYDYIDTAAKDIFNTNIVHNAKIHAQVLRAKGLNSSATLIEDWAAEAYAGITPRISRGVRTFLPMQAIRPGLWLRRRLTSAVFPLNWTWNLFVQTSSGALTIMRYGVVNTINGLDALLTPSGWKYTKEAYSVIIKGRRGGKVAYQDIGASIEKTMALQGAPIEKFEHWLNFLTNTIEGALTRISVRAAYWDGMRKGLKVRELLQYASEGGAKTQSMYNLEDLPGVLRAKEVGAAVPFQTFAFEVFNSVRELNIIGIRRVVGKAGAYESTSAKSAKGKATISKRLKMLAEWVAAITAVNLVVDKAINRKPWNVSSFIPFWAIMSSGMNAGNPWNQLLPVRYSMEFYWAITSFIKYGNWNKLRRWAVRYHIPAGMQLSRMMDGLEAVIEGRVTDATGRTLFRVPPDEWFRAIFMGPYQTEQGREYIDKMQESKGPLWEPMRIPLPSMGKGEAPKAPGRPAPRGTKTLKEILGE